MVKVLVLVAGLLMAADGDGCDTPSSGGNSSNDATPAPSTSVKGTGPDGAAAWATVEVCRDELVFRGDPDKQLSIRCTSPQAHGHEIMWGDKDKQQPALLCTCPDHGEPLAASPTPPAAQATPPAPDAGKGKLCLAPCP